MSSDDVIADERVEHLVELKRSIDLALRKAQYYDSQSAMLASLAENERGFAELLHEQWTEMKIELSLEIEDQDATG